MKLLDGSEVAGFVKERQARQVRNLRQTWQVVPRLAIVRTLNDPVIATYVRMKQRYAEDILVETDQYQLSQQEVAAVIARLNDDPTVHGIIVQLPLDNPSQTDELVRLVAPEKDVDGLGSTEFFTPATAQAIDWLLAAYGVELNGASIGVVGQGRLVGRPLTALWRERGYAVTAYDETSQNLEDALPQHDVLVTATGVPGLITDQMVGKGATVVDAGTASENGVVVGDVAEAVRQRDDITITPTKGGVGPLTIAALLDNVIASARRVADKTKRD